MDQRRFVQDCLQPNGKNDTQILVNVEKSQPYYLNVEMARSTIENCTQTIRQELWPKDSGYTDGRISIFDSIQRVRRQVYVWVAFSFIVLSCLQSCKLWRLSCMGCAKRGLASLFVFFYFEVLFTHLSSDPYSWERTCDMKRTDLVVCL